MSANKKASSLKRSILAIALLCTTLAAIGCTGTATPDPVIGSWHDDYLGLAAMEFSAGQDFFLQLSNTSYNGTWSRLNDTCYRIQYRNSQSPAVYDNTVLLAGGGDTLYLMNDPKVTYSKVSDVIVGMWTSGVPGTSAMIFVNDGGYHVGVGNVTYDGNWTRQNDTEYVISYHEAGNASPVYQEMLVYDRPDGTIYMQSAPQVTYTRGL